MPITTRSKSKKFLAYALSIAASTGISGCSSDNDDAPEVPAIVDNDEASLAKRMDTTQAEIALENAEGQELVGLLPGLDSFVALQVGEISAPTVGGLKTQANDVAVSGTAVYVAYNYAGDPYAGGIDVLDITNILSLKLLSSLALPNTDVNGIVRSGTNLYAVGAANTEKPAFLKQIALNGSLMTSTINTVALSSYAGTDVEVSGNNLFATSGDGGGLTTLTIPAMTQTKATTIKDARAVAVNSNGEPTVLSGQPGTASLFDSSGTTLSKTFALGGNATVQSKSSVYVGKKWSVASLGEAGFSVYCNSTGAVIQTVPAVKLASTASEKTVTNAVTSSNGLIYTANGEAGVYVYLVKDLSSSGTCGTGSVTLLGTLNFGAGFSANSIYASPGFLYVATGLGGLRILTTTVVTTSIVTSNL